MTRAKPSRAIASKLPSSASASRHAVARHAHEDRIRAHAAVREEGCVARGERHAGVVGEARVAAALLERDHGQVAARFVRAVARLGAARRGLALRAGIGSRFRAEGRVVRVGRRRSHAARVPARSARACSPVRGLALEAAGVESERAAGGDRRDDPGDARGAPQKCHVASSLPPAGPTPARSAGVALAAASSLGLAVKKRTAPTPTPTTATPVSTSLTSAIDLIELTLSSEQLGLQFFSASLNLPLATSPLITAPTAA